MTAKKTNIKPHMVKFKKAQSATHEEMADMLGITMSQSTAWTSGRRSPKEQEFNRVVDIIRSYGSDGVSKRKPEPVKVIPKPEPIEDKESMSEMVIGGAIIVGAAMIAAVFAAL